MKHLQLEKFEGPLDLLLSLIQDKKLEITDIALAEVTEPYMRALQKRESWLKPAEMADFLVIASRLLLIKSRVLLPLFDWEDDEEESLTAQLRMYKLYADAAQVVDAIAKKGACSFGRPRALREAEAAFSPPPKLSSLMLTRAMMDVIAQLEPLRRIPEKIYRRVASLQERIGYIHDLIKKRRMLSFAYLLGKERHRSEVVVNFLAVLELAKQHRVVARQKDNFADIEIVRA